MNHLFGLKSYLMEGFRIQNHKRISLIEIYVFDHKSYMSLAKHNRIKQDAITFFYEKGDEIRSATKIPNEAFRKLQYEMIIDEYLESERDKNGDISKGRVEGEKEAIISQEQTASSIELEKKQETMVEENEKDPIALNDLQLPQNQQKKPLYCLKEMCILEKIGVDEVKLERTDKTLIFPKYYCPKCRQKYTSLHAYGDGRLIKLDGVEYINLNPRYDDDWYINEMQKMQSTSAGSRCYVYDGNKPKECYNCQDSNFVEMKIQYKAKKNRTHFYHALYCVNCNLYYLDYNIYRKYRKDWILLNRDDLHSIQDEIRTHKVESRKRKTMEKEKLDAQKYEVVRHNEELKRLAKSGSKLEEKSAVQRTDSIGSQKLFQNQDNVINVKDFVVRRSTFKCRHDDHKLQNIDAIIKIIDRNGNISETRVSAGYCPNCNVYFIMESTYQNLKTRGTPICRVSDEKAYLSNDTLFNGGHLAQESILKQYGYSVSQEEGLTSARRQKILALLVDNKVLTRSEIISYLDFFINQRKHQFKYEKAIDKWESDREFISEYKSGAYTRYGVKSIYRKY